MLVVLLSLLSLTSLHPIHGVSVSVSVEEVLTHQKHSLDLSAKVTASTQPRLFSPQTYIQTFFGALGSGISSLIGLEGGAEESKSFTDLQGQHTGSNVQVRLPQCPVTGAQGRVRKEGGTRRGEDLLLLQEHKILDGQRAAAERHAEQRTNLAEIAALAAPLGGVIRTSGLRARGCRAVGAVSRLVGPSRRRACGGPSRGAPRWPVRASLPARDSDLPPSRGATGRPHPSR